MPILAVPVGPGPAALHLVEPLLRALHGAGPLLLPYAEGTPAPAHGTDHRDPLPPGATVAIGTSGTTGQSKRAVLTDANLRAAAQGTADLLGGTGQWLLALPAQHIGGLQVMVRSLLAGHPPVTLPGDGRLTPPAFVKAAGRLTTPRRYLSLVPTQLMRLMSDAAARATLADFDAVLVGGSALPADQRAQAVVAGIRVTESYGMSEASGGCVYDGRPFPGVDVAVAPDGHIHLGGPTIAHGYLGASSTAARAFTERDGARWFETSDLGTLTADGRLVVLGRADDMIVTGGVKVAPHVVEAALRRLDQVADALVVGLPDTQWGQVVAAVVTPARPGAITLPALRDELRAQLPNHALPRRMVTVDAIPLLGIGKPDGRAARMLFDTHS